MMDLSLRSEKGYAG